MSGIVASSPHLTASASQHLAGRPVHVRSSRRNGCCGGSASVPVAEPGAPETLDDVERFEVSGTVVYVDRGLLATNGSWVIDTEGFSRWRRLVVLGVDLALGDQALGDRG